jgi:hypothetical protein
MRTITILQVVPLSIFLACTKGGEPGPSAPMPAPETGYATCGGQKLAAAAAAPRSGHVEVQLAPAFLDEMSACRPESALPDELIAKAGDGVITQQGDCEYASVGVACHYHAGSEFISSATTGQTPGQGELHCIFPSSDPKSPSVYGGHVACRGANQGEPHGGGAPSHDVKAGATCPAGLLAELRSFQAFRCCDEGTLTNPIANLVRDGKNDIRPDFRIGSETIEIDCALLANLTPHDANSPALGGVGAPAFSALAH